MLELEGIDQQNVACGPYLAHYLFLYSLQAKNSFYIIKWLGKTISKEESYFVI